MSTALLGHTGFVGSNLLDAKGFDDLYNTSNVQDIVGREYDLVVVAASRADSFRINNHGSDDLAEIDALIDLVEKARVRKLVLISTVCVYPAGGAPDEKMPLSASGLTPYGANRLHQERRMQAAFDTLVVRLPQLYGSRLRKGVVYDLANEYRVEYIRPQTAYQHYDVRNLWRDVSTALTSGLESLNVATPPITNAELAREVFGLDLSGQIPAEPESPFAQQYTRNMTTRHSTLFGGEGEYLCSRDSEIAQLSRFVQGMRTIDEGTR
ncbi:hypothetical protein FM104_07000 [Microbacterium esteraromaticum]|uniref:NAD-dependent epimerase/dehydratase domain-containing protein n=1 Tax=Microbacterium esteraromaticum TaxID=57043 RepID=A0A1R4JEN9_9MICO|nr:NAD-dependent epimerase/dehydratase family protein [Microbacterium esteraromaticum]SJN30497.1 hypothetical protein FM104_07000 [Microbacterium esteraromaticum]